MQTEATAAPAGGGEKVFCGIGGGVAVYKAVEVVSRLLRAGCRVQAAMTASAQRFVAPLTFQAVTGRPVQTALFPPPGAWRREELYPHLFPATETDLFVVLPATANLLARMAQGMADDVVTAAAVSLSGDCLRFFCPAMHSQMWEQDAVRANVRVLEERGWRCIGPAAGRLACGAEGPGRLVEPEEIADVLLQALRGRRTLNGRKVLILSGPTRESLDTVRFISNPSSGRMGLALAEEAAARGAEVDFLSGPVDGSRLPSGPRLALHQVVSCEEMLDRARGLFPSADLIVFAAAPADYRPEERASSKRPRRAGALEVRLLPTPDIAATLCAHKKPGQVAVGFALQDEAAEERAAAKLAAKHLDALVLNGPAAMGAEEAEYRWLTRGAAAFESWGRISKRDCARRLLDAAVRLLADAAG